MDLEGEIMVSLKVLSQHLPEVTKKAIKNLRYMITWPRLRPGMN
jgi:hypothetical protein